MKKSLNERGDPKHYKDPVAKLAKPTKGRKQKKNPFELDPNDALEGIVPKKNLKKTKNKKYDYDDRPGVPVNVQEELKYIEKEKNSTKSFKRYHELCEEEDRLIEEYIETIARNKPGLDDPFKDENKKKKKKKKKKAKDKRSHYNKKDKYAGPFKSPSEDVSGHGMTSRSSIPTSSDGGADGIGGVS